VDVVMVATAVVVPIVVVPAMMAVMDIMPNRNFLDRRNG
jgi:hypothetical protein